MVIMSVNSIPDPWFSRESGLDVDRRTHRRDGEEDPGHLVRESDATVRIGNSGEKSGMHSHARRKLHEPRH